MKEMMTKWRGIWIGSFWAGCALFALGQLITFYPGAERGWFILAGLLCMSGLLIRGKAYRIAAIILVGLSAVLATVGHRRGVDYKKWLETEKKHRQETEPANAPYSEPAARSPQG